MDVGSSLSSPQGVAVVVNSNLLLFTEQLDNAVWTKASVTVTADAATDPLGGATADRIVGSSIASTVTQASSVSAASGSGAQVYALTTSWVRYSVTATFDVGQYTFSCWLKEASGGGSDYSLLLLVSGGKITVRLRDGGDGVTLHAWGAKLESGATPTGDATNYGVNPAV